MKHRTIRPVPPTVVIMCREPLCWWNSHNSLCAGWMKSSLTSRCPLFPRVDCLSGPWWGIEMVLGHKLIHPLCGQTSPCCLSVPCNLNSQRSKCGYVFWCTGVGRVGVLAEEKKLTPTAAQYLLTHFLSLMVLSIRWVFSLYCYIYDL